ncbi:MULTISPECIES: hypothetical protein [unclassified Streptomyces]|uniref:hypothetical protein n=1 Tax=unclassified Streptomyces TaxID=2593676 RepID=UPI002E2CCC91|nr:hypothetical protein [Streptomyces sp. NBC_01429]
MRERRGIAAHLVTRVVGALLCLGVAAIHVRDQGGIPGSQSPPYIASLFWALEIVAVLTALLLLAGVIGPGWFLAMGVAAGPLVGYVLTRGPGLPDDHGDVGNWSDPLGLVSLAFEGALLILSVTCFLLRGTRRAPRHAAGRGL